MLVVVTTSNIYHLFLFAGEEATDFPFETQLPYIRNRVKLAAKKWSSVQRLLEEREHQLEMSMGSMVAFLEAVAELLTWTEEKLRLDALSATPPASLPALRGYVETLEVTGRVSYFKMTLEQRSMHTHTTHTYTHTHTHTHTYTHTHTHTCTWTHAPHTKLECNVKLNDLIDSAICHTHAHTHHHTCMHTHHRCTHTHHTHTHMHTHTHTHAHTHMHTHTAHTHTTVNTWRANRPAASLEERSGEDS